MKLLHVLVINQCGEAQPFHHTTGINGTFYMSDR